MHVRMKHTPRTLLTTLLAAGGLALAAGSPAVASAADETPPTAGSTPAFTLEWGRFDRDHRSVAGSLRKSKALGQIVREVNSRVALPREIPIMVSDDLEIGPAYLPSVRLRDGSRISFINVPGSFLRLTTQVVRRELDGSKELKPRRAMALAMQFVLAHEMGHAIVDQLRIPVTGREEDAVDGFAAYMLADNPRFGPLSVIAAAMFFDGIATAPRDLKPSHFADEHSLLQQRVYQFMCWVYGSHPRRFRALVGRDLLPRERAVRCPAEWRQLNRSWSRLLAPHAKEQPAQ